MPKNSKRFAFLMTSLFVASLVIFFTPLPYYQSSPILCKLGGNCPKVGWNIGPSLFRQLFPGFTSGQPFQSIHIDTPKSQAKILNLLDITLQINAPYSKSRLTIFFDDGALEYRHRVGAKGPEKIEAGKSTPQQLSQIKTVIEKNDFTLLKNSPKNPDNPEDGSYYYLTLKYFPGDPFESMYPSKQTVYCYQFACEPAFLAIKEQMHIIWGKEILEIGV